MAAGCEGPCSALRRGLRRLQQAPLRRTLITEKFSPSPGEIHVVLGVDSSGLDALLASLVAEVPLAYVRRNPSLNGRADLADNVFLGIEPRRRVLGVPGILDRPALRARATALLRRVDVYTPITTAAGGLDAASTVLVEVARALAHGATVIALHEPTARLTAAGADRIFRVLRRLANDGLAIVVASQRPSLALDIGDRVSVLAGGRVASVLGAGERRVDARGRLLEAMAGVGSSDQAAEGADSAAEGADSAPVGADSAAAGADRAAEAADGVRARDRVAAGHAAGGSASTPEVEIAHWSTFDEFDRGRPVVVDATVTARAGEITGLAGLDGSGRNELLLSVFGRTAGTPPTGAVLLGGRPVDTSTTTAAIANGIFMIATVQPKYRVRIVGGISAPVTGSMLPALVSAGLASRDEGEASTSPGGKALDLVRSRGRDDEWVRIRSLLELFPASEHRVLLLVEPTRGLDEGQRAEVWRLLHDVRAAGKAVLLASSDVGELLSVCDRVVAMADGRVAGELGAGASVVEVVALIAPH